jgi:hypothetical protein
MRRHPTRPACPLYEWLRGENQFEAKRGRTPNYAGSADSPLTRHSERRRPRRTQAPLRWHEVPKQQRYVSYCEIVRISPF